MKLKVKEEFLSYSIGGGRLNKMRLDNIPPSLYEKYYNLGFQDVFEVIEDKPLKESKKPLKTDENDKIED